MIIGDIIVCSNITYSLNPVSWKMEFKCSEPEDSFYVYMNSLEVDELISLGENVKKVVNDEKKSMTVRMKQVKFMLKRILQSSNHMFRDLSHQN